MPYKWQDSVETRRVGLSPAEWTICDGYRKGEVAPEPTAQQKRAKGVIASPVVNGRPIDQLHVESLESARPLSRGSEAAGPVNGFRSIGDRHHDLNFGVRGPGVEAAPSANLQKIYCS